MYNTISTIIFRNYHYENLKEQVESIKNQTKKVDNIIIINNFENNDKNKIDLIGINSIDINQKINLISAFVIALNCNTDYVCIINDYAIFGDKWFEFAIALNKKMGGLIGCKGVKFNKNNLNLVDSNTKNKNPIVVDILYGIWFFKREYLASILKEMDSADNINFDESEILISYSVQKYLKLNSYVIPLNENSLFNVEINQNNNYSLNNYQILEKYKEKGFEIISEKENNLKNYNDGLTFLFNKMLKKEPFSFIRYGDGEYFISNNKDYKSTREDDWNYKSNSFLTEHLNETFDLTNSNTYYGIHAVCDVLLYYEYYMNKIISKENLSFACLFCNKNFLKFKEFIENNEFNIVLISSKYPQSGKIGKLKIIDSYIIDDKLVPKWDLEFNNHFQYIEKLALKHTNEIFFFAAGPIAKIFIYKMYKVNPNNIYCDIGSALDPFIKNTYSRAYFYQNTLDSQHICHF